MFFDDNPEFLETSTTASSKRRLNLRHIGIIEENEEILRGSSVVDIASHDGRWSYAALHAGATHVTGVEGRRHLIDATRQTFDAKAVPAPQYTLIQGTFTRHCSIRKSSATSSYASDSFTTLRDTSN